MQIPFVDLKAQYARLKPRIEARIQTVLEHGQYIMGPEVRELEERLASFAGCRHAIAVSSGTDALQVALMAAGVGAGDAVFVPSFTFTASAEVVLNVGATPVFVDVATDSYNILAEDLEERIAAVRRQGALRPRAIIAVDLFGLPADYDALNAIAARHGLFLLGDAAQSFGASWRGRKVGSLAPVTATSFFPAKPLGGYGDGGAIFTDDDSLADAMRSIRMHGQGEHRYDIVRIGMNGRLDTLQAAILLAKLEVFPEELEARDRLARRYNERLGSAVAVPSVPANEATSAWAQYTIQLDDRDRVAEALKAKGIPTAVYYPRPMHQQPAYAPYAPAAGSLRNSEALCRRVLSLPMHGYLDGATADYVAESVLEAALQ